MSARNSSRKLTKAEARRPSYTPYQPQPLRTEYDEPLPLDGNDAVIQLGSAMLEGAKLLRKRAHKLLDAAAWGDAGGSTERDDESLFEEAGFLNRDADILVDEYHRRVRAHWLASRPGGHLSGKRK
jgi:hypothetical protein